MKPALIIDLVQVSKGNMMILEQRIATLMSKALIIDRNAKAKTASIKRIILEKIIVISHSFVFPLKSYYRLGRN